MPEGFHDGSRSLQDRFDTRAIADRIDELLERGHRMRLEGTATVELDDPLLDDYPEAQFVVRVRARAVYPNCPRYIHRYQLVRRSRFVPREDCLTPVPEWKRSEWAFDALPENDPARDPGEREVY